jgi:hypothetical protein
MLSVMLVLALPSRPREPAPRHATFRRAGVAAAGDAFVGR